MNIFLDLNFLQTTYIDLMKSSIFYLVISGIITLLLIVLCYILKKGKLSYCAGIIGMIVFLITISLCAVSVLEIIIYIPAVIATYLKLYAIEIFELQLVSEYLLNLTVSIISVSFCIFILGLLFNHMVKKSEEGRYIKHSEINEDTTNE